MKTLIAALALIAGAAQAGEPVIEEVRAENRSGGWTFHVTLSHGDTGWDHYADGWRVLAPDGTELGMRTLYHPHVEEQPFTRSLGGVRVPEGVTSVIIEARDKVHGWAKATVEVDLSE